jgi:hypothetical protein
MACSVDGRTLSSRWRLLLEGGGGTNALPMRGMPMPPTDPLI